jgi:hypothetical protein
MTGHIGHGVSDARVAGGPSLEAGLAARYNVGA